MSNFSSLNGQRIEDKDLIRLYIFTQQTYDAFRQIDISLKESIDCLIHFRRILIGVMNCVKDYDPNLHD